MKKLEQAEDPGKRQDLKRTLDEVRERAHAERKFIRSLKRRIEKLQEDLG